MVLIWLEENWMCGSKRCRAPAPPGGGRGQANHDFPVGKRRCLQARRQLRLQNHPQIKFVLLEFFFNAERPDFPGDDFHAWIALGKFSQDAREDKRADHRRNPDANRAFLQQFAVAHFCHGVLHCI